MDSTVKNSADRGFPVLPAEDLFAHTASAYLDRASAYLTGRGLRHVANGDDPSSVRHIVDHPMEDLPMLSPTDPGYQRRIEVRNRYLTQNAANELKRCDLRYTAWTEI